MQLLDFEVGHDRPLFLIAGPCVIETEKLILDTAQRLREITDALGIPFIFKSSFDKANRSSHESYRGPGIEEGLRILEKELLKMNGIPSASVISRNRCAVSRMSFSVSMTHGPAIRNNGRSCPTSKSNNCMNVSVGQVVAVAIAVSRTGASIAAYTSAASMNPRNNG